MTHRAVTLLALVSKIATGAEVHRRHKMKPGGNYTAPVARMYLRWASEKRPCRNAKSTYTKIALYPIANHHKPNAYAGPGFALLINWLGNLIELLVTLPVKYLVLDGHFGNNNALQMVRQATPWHLISKLRQDAALYFLYDGEQKPKGRRKRYGDKVNYQALPQKYLVATSEDEKIQTLTYQATMLHKSFAQPLNVVVVVMPFCLAATFSPMTNSLTITSCASNWSSPSEMSNNSGASKTS